MLLPALLPFACVLLLLDLRGLEFGPVDVGPGGRSLGCVGMLLTSPLRT